MCYDCDDARESRHPVPLVRRIVTERLTWAMHLVNEHGAFGSRDATPCYHQRGDRTVVSDTRTRLIILEYDRLTRGETR